MRPWVGVGSPSPWSWQEPGFSSFPSPLELCPWALPPWWHQMPRFSPLPGAPGAEGLQEAFPVFLLVPILPTWWPLPNLTAGLHAPLMAHPLPHARSPSTSCRNTEWLSLTPGTGHTSASSHQLQSSQDQRCGVCSPCDSQLGFCCTLPALHARWASPGIGHEAGGNKQGSCLPWGLRPAAGSPGTPLNVTHCLSPGFPPGSVVVRGNR